MSFVFLEIIFKSKIFLLFPTQTFKICFPSRTEIDMPAPDSADN